MKGTTRSPNSMDVSVVERTPRLGGAIYLIPMISIFAA
jgi:hypothetical protein